MITACVTYITECETLFCFGTQRPRKVYLLSILLCNVILTLLCISCVNPSDTTQTPSQETLVDDLTQYLSVRKLTRPFSVHWRTNGDLNRKTLPFLHTRKPYASSYWLSKSSL